MRTFNRWGSGDSNPDALRHQILSLARLPIPALPRENNMILSLVVFPPYPHYQSLPLVVLKCQPRLSVALEYCPCIPRLSRYYIDVTTVVYKRLGRW